MWPFQSPKGRADAALAIMPEAISAAAGSWKGFCEKLIFKEDVPLVDRITAFSMPAEAGLRARFPALKKAPDSVIMLIVAKGVEASGTHTTKQIEEALGIALPA